MFGSCSSDGFITMDGQNEHGKDRKCASHEETKGSTKRSANEASLQTSTTVFSKASAAVPVVTTAAMRKKKYDAVSSITLALASKGIPVPPKLDLSKTMVSRTSIFEEEVEKWAVMKKIAGRDIERQLDDANHSELAMNAALRKRGKCNIEYENAVRRVFFEKAKAAEKIHSHQNLLSYFIYQGELQKTPRY